MSQVNKGDVSGTQPSTKMHLFRKRLKKYVPVTSEIYINMENT